MDYVSKRKQMAEGHVPNKLERKELARLQQKSGKTEEELRADKSNRVLLSQAQKARGDGSNADRLRHRKFRKLAAEQLSTHINDPRVEGEAKRIMTEEARLPFWQRSW